jgi:hypothetical protein|tara:strand:+ start:1120 stop:2175 length:1056 start_codon:yes stop_codon:yes gene_type:complete
MAWTIETIKAGRLGQFPSLINISEEPAILYAGSLKQSVECARRVGTNWVTGRVRDSNNGIIGSVDAEDTLGGLAAVAFIDRPETQSDLAALSDVIYASFDGNVWNSQVVASDAFSQRFFHSVKLLQLSTGPVVGWAQRAASSDLSLVVSEKKTGGWVESAVPEATMVDSSWDISRVEEGHFGVAFFDSTNRQVKYARRKAGIWTTEIALTLSAGFSLTGISLTDVDGQPSITYQINFAKVTLPGDQRHVSRDADGIWKEENVERPISVSGFVDNSTSVNHKALPTVAYHIRQPDKINYAELVENKEYDVFLWVIEEVGTNIAMPSHRHIAGTTYVAAYGTKAQSIIIAERT